MYRHYRDESYNFAFKTLIFVLFDYMRNNLMQMYICKLKIMPCRRVFSRQPSPRLPAGVRRPGITQSGVAGALRSLCTVPGTRSAPRGLTLSSA